MALRLLGAPVTAAATAAASRLASAAVPRPGARGLWAASAARPVSPASPPLPLIRHGLTGRMAYSSARTAASNASSFSFSPIDWWRGRQERTEATKYRERIHDMAHKERWTIGDMQMELQEVEKSWLAKVQDSAEVRQARQLLSTIRGVIAELGVGATDEDLAAMTRTQKLRAAASVPVSVEQVNILIQQFQTMGLMHRVLRSRVGRGQSIPTTAEAMQALMQVEGPKLMSAAHKKNMLHMQQQRMKRALVKRRR